MKKVKIAIFFIISSNTAWSQNTFPATGNVGIGITSPISDLHIKGDRADLYLENTDANNWAFMRIKGSGNNFWDIGQYGNNDFLEFRPMGSSNANRVVIKQNGRMGIGTTNPGFNLHIEKSTASGGVNSVIRNLNSGTGAYTGFRIGNDAAATKFIIFTNSTSRSTDGGAGNTTLRTDSGDLLVNASGNLGLATNGGKVGIGTINPGFNLHIEKSTASGGVNSVIRNLNSGTGAYTGFRIGNDAAATKFIIFTNSTNRSNDGGTGNTTLRTDSGDLLINASGNLSLASNGGMVGIGTTDPKSKLAVNGQIRATEVKVLADISVPDYVFESDYELRTLKETKEYITENKHLPEIPSAAEIGENGIDLGEMNMRLLKKIEELTLHLIEQNERVEKLEKELSTLKNK